MNKSKLNNAISKLSKTELAEIFPPITRNNFVVRDNWYGRNQIITSSPGFSPRPIIAIWRASVPLAQGITCLTPRYASKFDWNDLTAGPLINCALESTSCIPASTCSPILKQKRQSAHKGTSLVLIWFLI